MLTKFTLHHGNSLDTTPRSELDYSAFMPMKPTVDDTTTTDPSHNTALGTTTTTTLRQFLPRHIYDVHYRQPITTVARFVEHTCTTTTTLKLSSLCVR